MVLVTPQTPCLKELSGMLLKEPCPPGISPIIFSQLVMAEKNYPNPMGICSVFVVPWVSWLTEPHPPGINTVIFLVMGEVIIPWVDTLFGLINQLH